MIENFPNDFKAKVMYGHALSFCKLADYAYKEMEKPDEWRIYDAGVVNAAFACEMFLKALLTFSNIRYGKIHSLKDLFEKLPQNYREYIDTTVFDKSGGWVKDSFDVSFLDSISNSFVEWRYWFEQQKASINMPTFYLHAFRKTLQELCEKEFGIKKQGR